MLISKITSDRYFIDYCYKLTGGKDIYKDLYQFILLALLEMPKDKQEAIANGNYKNYVTRMIWLNWKSDTAPFRKLYIFKEEDLDQDIKEEIEDIQYSEDSLQIIDEVLREEIDYHHKKKTFPWNVELFKMYVDVGSYHEMARKINIPYATVRYNINDLIVRINERIANHK